jgi:hypothetical protein
LNCGHPSPTEERWHKSQRHVRAQTASQRRAPKRFYENPETAQKFFSALWIGRAGRKISCTWIHL